MKFYLTFLIVASQISLAVADVLLPSIFGSHMVLQQNDQVKVWGWAKPMEPVVLKASWDPETEYKTQGDPNAKWEILLKTPSAGGPYSITIQGYNTIVFDDVLIGEVWLCSGQSNMEWSFRSGIENGDEELKKADYPEIRFFSVKHQTADGPQLDLNGQWVVCKPETAHDFSAIGYFFGRKLHQELKVPVGLVNSSWGGTPAEAWTSPEAINADETLKKDAENMKQVPWGPVGVGKIFHAMIKPMVPFKIAGVLWYQGESNVMNAKNYSILLPALITNWRKEWGHEFPFYFVQIAPYIYGQPEEGVLLREAQRRSLEVPNTGMVVTSDIGNIEDIHPRNKIDVGLRLANLALNKNYNKTHLPFSGPLFKDMKVEGRKVRINFDHAENGLIKKGKDPLDFEIAGEDGMFVKATAKIEGSSVVVHSKSVKDPVAVRFGWSNTANPNLFNQEGLPASSFTTGNW